MAHNPNMSEEEQDALPQALLSRMTSLGSTLRSQWESEAVPERRDTELRWIDDLYQYRSEYTPDEEARMDKNGSRIFPPSTRKKVTTIYSRLRDLLFPPSEEQNWSLAATNDPVLGPKDKQEAVQRAQQKAMEEAEDEGEQGGPPQGQPQRRPAPDEDMIEACEKEIAEEASERMSDRIKEQLSERRYSEVGGRVILSGCIYGTGILKGPLVDLKQVTRYTNNGGQWVPTLEEEFQPYIEQVTVWDMYPDMSGRDWDDLRYIYHRHRMLRQDVLALAERDDFDAETIIEYVKHHRDGDAADRGEETRIRTLGDRGHIANPNEGRFEVLEYWGIVDVNELLEAVPGIAEELDADIQEVWANVWLLGSWVIKAVLSPSPGDKKHPFHAFEFDEGDISSIFCQGVPALMRDDQKMLGASTRAMLDNAGVASGPMLEVNEDMLAPGENAEDIYPRRVFRRSGMGHEAQYPAVREIPVNSYIGDYINLIKLSESWIHEHTVPSYLEGQGTTSSGAQGTASGLSMLMGAANIELKSLARNYDEGVTVPFIGAMYAWNMEFSDDEAIKGDYEVYARGSASMVAKEQRAQQLDQFAAQETQMPTANRMNWKKLLRQRLEAHDLSDDELILSDEEFEQQQGPSFEQQIRKLEAQIESSKVEAEVKMKEVEAQKVQEEVLNLRAERELKEAEAARAWAEVEGRDYEEPDYSLEDEEGRQGGQPTAQGGRPAPGGDQQEGPGGEQRLPQRGAR